MGQCITPKCPIEDMANKKSLQCTEGMQKFEIGIICTYQLESGLVRKTKAGEVTNRGKAACVLRQNGQGEKRGKWEHSPVFEGCSEKETDETCREGTQCRSAIFKLFFLS